MIEKDIECCIKDHITVDRLKIKHFVTGGIKGIYSGIREDGSRDDLDLCTFGAIDDGGSCNIPYSSDPVGTLACCLPAIFRDLKEIIADPVMSEK